MTDSTGCTATASMPISQPPQLVIDTVILSYYNGWNVSCNGACDGTAMPSASAEHSYTVHSADKLFVQVHIRPRLQMLMDV
jgi:hypothetical protein